MRRLEKINQFIHKFKYEILAITLFQHLYIGIFIQNLEFYILYVWPLNMLLLGLASTGIFRDKRPWEKWLKNFFLLIVVGFPLAIWFHFDTNASFMLWLNVSYLLFFSFILYEVFLFLLIPNYINLDLIVASICGYLLLIELATYAFQFYFYQYPHSFSGVHNINKVDTYASFVYFSSVTITCIGFGDIRPTAHTTKLLTSLLGVIGQLYSVLLLGLLISKFSNQRQI